MRSKNFEYNDRLNYIIDKAHLKPQEIAQLIDCHHTSVANWIENEYKMKKEAFNRLMEELPVFLEERIAYHQKSLTRLTSLYKQIVSTVHNNLHN